MAATKMIQNCSIHSENLLQYFCSNCRNIACKDCKHLLSCYQNGHQMIPIRIAVEEFNKKAKDVIKISEDMTIKIERKFDLIVKDNANLEYHLNLCKTTIELQTKMILKKVKEQSNELLLKLENLYQERKEAMDTEMKDFDAMRDQVNHLKASVKLTMDKPEETETLELYKKSLGSINNKILENEDVPSLHKQNIPIFIPSTYLNELVTTEGLGKVLYCNQNFQVAEEDRLVEVSKGQSFEVKVSSNIDIGSQQITLTANLTNKTGEISATEIENQGNGKYKIKGRCRVEGNWQMKITIGGLHIKGSPVNIKVEKIGLVKTIENTHIPDKMTDVILDKNGSMLVSYNSDKILRFNQSGSYMNTVQVPKEREVKRMHLMSNGRIIYITSVKGRKCVMCDETFKEIRSFGKGMLQCPSGLTVNEERRELYITDFAAHCVFKFNVDDGKLLGNIVLKDSIKQNKLKPMDVALTESGNIIVADFSNNRLCLFDPTNGDLVKIIVGCGEEDGKVLAPYSLLVDFNGKLIVASNHKLQLFNTNGVFIKRLDDESDGLKVPFGMSIISNRPRRIAVANFKANNLKIFNY